MISRKYLILRKKYTSVIIILVQRLDSLFSAQVKSFLSEEKEASSEKAGEQKAKSIAAIGTLAEGESTR